MMFKNYVNMANSHFQAKGSNAQPARANSLIPSPVIMDGTKTSSWELENNEGPHSAFSTITKCSTKHQRQWVSIENGPAVPLDRISCSCILSLSFNAYLVLWSSIYRALYWERKCTEHSTKMNKTVAFCFFQLSLFSVFLLMDFIMVSEHYHGLIWYWLCHCSILYCDLIWCEAI